MCWIPGLGRSPGEGNGYPLQHSCLENPHGQRSLACYIQSKGSQRVRQNWSDLNTAQYCFQNAGKNIGRKESLLLVTGALFPPQDGGLFSAKIQHGKPQRWDGPGRFGKTERVPPPRIYARAQVCTTTTLMPLASPGLESPRKGLDKSLDTLNTSEPWHLFYCAHHTTNDSRITILHTGPQVPSCSNPVSRNVSPPSLLMGKRDQPKHRTRKWEEGLYPVPPSREPGVYYSDSVQTPQPVYGVKEHCPLESPRRTLEGRQRGPSGGVRCPALPTLGTQAYSPVKCRPHSQVVLINNRPCKALFSFSLHPS